MASGTPLNLRAHIVPLLVTALTLFVLDGVWLGAVAQAFYAAQLKDLLAPQVYLPAAAAFYILYIGALHITAVVPSRSLKEAAWRGAAQGLLVYGSYELTNLAMVRDWPAQLVFVDWAWGVLLTAVTASVGNAVWRRRNR